METHIVTKSYTPEELVREWARNVWQNTPEKMVTVPFPGGVLVGIKDRDTGKRVSFLLPPEDARFIGENLIAAAQEATNDLS